MYTKEKIGQQLQQFSEQLYANFTSVSGMQLWHDTREKHLTLPPKDAAWQPVKLGDHWDGRDQYYWLQFNLAVPALAKAQHYVLHLVLGRTGGGNNSGFEGEVYINGEIYQAVDGNHEELYLDSSWANKAVTVQILLWTGLEGGGPKKIQHYTLDAASSGVLIQPIRDCYRWLDLMYQTTLELDANEPLLYEYEKLLDKELRRFIWGAMSLDEIEEISKSALVDIQDFLKAHKGQKKQFHISAIGHTHIDVAWLWRLKHTREKGARSFSTVLEMMKEYPDYLFMHSTPQVWEFVKEDHPELFARIKKRVAEGRFEPEGATWVEPDTNMPSGESLTRQFLYGTRFFMKEFGAKQNVLWLPDVFGYSWALPQIMKGFGISNFMTTKISWNDTNRMPHDTFIWKGIDGSEVLTHFITTVDQGDQFHNSHNWQYTYNGNVTPHTVLGSYYVYADKALNNDLLLSYGWGDGGGGPQREMIENVDMLNQLPGLPTVEDTRVDDYFKRLNDRLKKNDQPLAVWNGELYLEFHRGTYTSQSRVKRQNRELEFDLRDTELRYVQAGIENGTAYPQLKFEKLWEKLLTNQFHDILPGSAIHEVYEDNKKEFAGMFKELADMNQALDEKDYTKTPDTYTLRNLNAFDLTDLVSVKETRGGHFEDAKGNALKSQRAADGYEVEAAVPALSEAAVRFVPEGQAAPAPKALPEADSVQFGHYQIKWNKAGQLTSVFDTDNKREVLGKDGRGNVLTVYEDRPTNFDNWNIDKDYPEKAIELTADKITVQSAGALSQQVLFHYTFLHSTVDQTLTLYKDDRRIDFKTTIDWHDHQFLLRTAFDSNILSSEATFDVQYGNVKRPTNDNTSWDSAKFETVGHKWADLAQRDYGVALLNNAKYGYRVKGQQLSLSLLKSGINPDTDADQGEQSFTYSLLPHEGDFVDGNLEKEAMALNHGLVVVAGKAQKPAKPLFTFDADQPVIVDAIKHSEDGDAVILRFHEYTGQAQTFTVHPQFAYQKVAAVRLDENKPQPVTTGANGAVTVDLTPYHVETLRFELK